MVSPLGGYLSPSPMSLSPFHALHIYAPHPSLSTSPFNPPPSTSTSSSSTVTLATMPSSSLSFISPHFSSPLPVASLTLDCSLLEATPAFLSLFHIPSASHLSHLSLLSCSSRFEIDGANNMKERTRRFPSEAAANAECALRLVGWQPLVWELSVDDFLSRSKTVQSRCKLYQSLAVSFQPRGDGLSQQLTALLGDLPSTAQLKWMAWFLGMWVTDGLMSRDCIVQGGPPRGQPFSHHRVMVRLRQYQALFGEPVKQINDGNSTAGHPVYYFEFGASRVKSVARRLLDAYGLIDHKHIPQAWICDTLEVRRRIFAGVLDGDGYYDPRNVYEVELASPHAFPA